MTAILDRAPAPAPPAWSVRRHPILRLAPVVLQEPKIFAATVAAILFHQACSVGAVVAGAVIVGQVAAGAGIAQLQPLLAVLAALVIGRGLGKLGGDVDRPRPRLPAAHRHPDVGL